MSGVFVSQMVEALADPQRLEALLNGLDSVSLERAIERLEDYEHEYDPAAVEPAIPVLLNQLPKLREGRRGMMDFGADLVVTRVVLRLLQRIDQEDARLAIVERMLPEVTQLSGRLELIDLAGHRENAGHRLIPADAATRLYEDLNAATLARAPPEDLAEERDLGHLFARLVEADADHGVRQVREACSDDRVMLQLLRSGFGERQRQQMGDYAVRTIPSLPWELFERWFGAPCLARARRGAITPRRQGCVARPTRPRWKRPSSMPQENYPKKSPSQHELPGSDEALRQRCRERTWRRARRRALLNAPICPYPAVACGRA